MLKQSMQLRLGQQLTLTPQLQQAIKLLQLSKLDLDLAINSALENNPMLELEESDETTTEAEIKPIEIKVDSSWEDTYPDLTYSNNSHEYNLENCYSNEDSLQDYLIWQLNLTPMSDRDKTIALAIIDAISDAGFLTQDLTEIAAALTELENLEQNEIEMVLHRIQQFDPLSVGARNLQECLAIQLKSLPETTPYLQPAQKALQHYVELLGKKNLSRLKSRMQIDTKTAEGILALLKSLNPIPGQALFSTKVEYIVPDLIVTWRENKFIVELNKDNSKHLRINPGYAALIKRADTSPDNKFLQEQLTEAKWFLKSLHNRNETLLKVGGAIMTHQQDFLKNGEAAMQPLVLSTIAQELNLHESTISRITTNKYIHTPRGVYELKYFFSSHVNDKQGKMHSSTAIKAFIKNIINTEDKDAPFSDNQLTLMLKEQGIDIARRTVAKYREALSIPPSNERRV